MIKPLVLVTLLLSGVAVMAQEQPAGKKIDDTILQKATLPYVDQFKAIVKKIITCAPVDYRGTMEMYSKDAYVEVSLLDKAGRVKKTASYPIDIYFKRLFKLHCSPKPTYIKLWINFNESDFRDGIVASVDGGAYTVTYDIEQDFMGETANGVVYKDCTIKQIILLCTPDGTGGLDIKIMAITVEKTKRHHLN